MLKPLIAIALLTTGIVSYADTDTNCIDFINSNLPQSSPLKVKSNGLLSQVPSKPADGLTRVFKKQSLTSDKANYEYVDTDGADSVSKYSITAEMPSRPLPGGWSGPKKITIEHGDMLEEIYTNSPTSGPCQIERIVTKSTSSLLDTKRMISYDQQLCATAEAIDTSSANNVSKFKQAYSAFEKDPRSEGLFLHVQYETPTKRTNDGEIIIHNGHSVETIFDPTQMALTSIDDVKHFVSHCKNVEAQLNSQSASPLTNSSRPLNATNIQNK